MPGPKENGNASNRKKKRGEDGGKKVIVSTRGVPSEGQGEK